MTNLVEVTLWNPDERLDTIEKWYQYMNDNVLSQLQGGGKLDQQLYNSSSYDIVIGSCYQPYDDDIYDDYFFGIGSDDDTTKDLGWSRSNNGDAVKFTILYLFDD